jgi:hypothetical protein
MLSKIIEEELTRALMGKSDHRNDYRQARVNELVGILDEGIQNRMPFKLAYVEVFSRFASDDSALIAVRNIYQRAGLPIPALYQATPDSQ